MTRGLLIATMMLAPVEGWARDPLQICALAVSVPGAPTLSVSFDRAEVLESAGTVSDAGRVTTNTALTSDLAVSLTASPAEPLVPESPVTLLAGSTSVEFDIILSDDAVEEEDSVVTVTATATAHSAGSDSILVRDDDGTLPIVSFETASQTVSETAGEIAVRITMTTPSETDIIVPFTLSGTAVDGFVDYAISQNQITIPGDGSSTTGQVRVVLIDDGAEEGDEEILFTMGTDAEITGATRTDPILHRVTIADGDIAQPDGKPDAEEPDTGDPNRFVPQNTILESSGCTCGGEPAPPATAVLAVWLSRRRRSQTITGLARTDGR
jgi:uncharacterized protein (TIGR03382 family)